jgi:hypothetical protein
MFQSYGHLEEHLQAALEMLEVEWIPHSGLQILPECIDYVQVW